MEDIESTIPAIFNELKGYFGFQRMCLGSRFDQVGNLCGTKKSDLHNHCDHLEVGHD